MVVKFLIVIPVFNNPESIRHVVEDCLTKTDLPLAVVDDGSDIKVTTQINPNPRITFLRLDHNQGKGAAILFGFEWAAKNGFTHVVTLDGDGQHKADDIAAVRAVAIEKPWSLVIGKRIFSGDNVPKISRFGRVFSNFWVQYETGSGVSDSQSGFRCYPVFHVQCLKLKHRRYDFELEVLILLLWKGVSVVEVPIEVIYPKAELRVSHFKKFRDNARISWLNAKLVVVGLLRRQTSSARLALGLGVGVAIGCTPFYGLHAVIALGISLVARLNFLAVFVGTQVSLPPLVPFIILSSVRIGLWMKGQPVTSLSSLPRNLHGAEHLFGSWLKGSLILGPAAGIVIGSLFFVIHSGIKKRTRQNWTGKTRGGTFGNAFMRKITETFGLRTAYFFLNFIVPYFYLFAPRARRGLHEYWKLQIPDAAYGTRVRLVFTQFYRFGQVLIDRLYQSHKSTQVFKANSHGIKNIVEPMATNGIVLIGAHVGGWDIAARYLEWHGLNGSFHPVQLVAEGNTFEKTLNPQEKTAVKKVITNRTALPIFEIRHMLSQSRPVGLMCDRPLTGNFELVPFLGKLAPFDTTAFRIAAATKSPVIFSLGFKSKHSGEYDFFATPPKSMEYSSLLAKEDQIKMWIAEFSIFLEERLKDYPEQWFNFFEFWSSVPETLGV
jgi:predicted LPLAT superfamily acyltransferase/uncharacterized protein (DUF2062 family)